MAKGRRRLAIIIGQMRHEIDDLHRPEFWYYAWHPVALALAGEHEAAIDLLGRALANHGSVWVRPGERAGLRAVSRGRSIPGLVAE